MHSDPIIQTIFSSSLFCFIFVTALNVNVLSTAFMEPDRLLKRYRRKRSTTDFNITTSNDGLRALRRSPRAVPHIIYPEILVIVDYDGYRLHGGDNVQVK